MRRHGAPLSPRRAIQDRLRSVSVLLLPNVAFSARRQGAWRGACSPLSLLRPAKTDARFGSGAPAEWADRFANHHANTTYREVKYGQGQRRQRGVVKKRQAA